MSHKHINNIDSAVSSTAEEWTDDPSLPPTIPDVSEQIFQCIQSGNDILEEISTTAAAAATDDTSSSLLVVVDSSNDEQLLYWKAAEYYMHACELLVSLLR